MVPPLQSIGTPAWWIGFSVFVAVILGLDLGIFNRRAHKITTREAGAWALFCIGCALVFNVLLYLRFGRAPALEFLTGYLIEEALSVDNLFVFVMIFSYFSVDVSHQHRVLFWGIMGAIIMRALFILAGSVLLAKFQWVVFIFGGFLLFTGIKFLFQKQQKLDPEKNPALRLFRRFIPMTPAPVGSKFVVRENGRWLATPLLLVLIVVETTDLIFAVDSIPAVFAVTRDPFIVYTSNIFAIMGLRALYFLLIRAVGELEYLQLGLGGVLVFVGLKMLVSHWFHIPIGLSLGVVAGLLGLSAAASVWKRSRTG